MKFICVYSKRWADKNLEGEVAIGFENPLNGMHISV